MRRSLQRSLLIAVTMIWSIASYAGTFYTSAAAESYFFIRANGSGPDHYDTHAGYDAGPYASSIVERDLYGTRSASTYASIGTAVLRTRSSVMGGAGSAPGNQSFAISNAGFGDSFTTGTASGSPFTWGGSNATFSLTVDGTTTNSGSAAARNVSVALLLILKAGSLRGALTNEPTGDGILVGLPTPFIASNLLAQFDFSFLPGGPLRGGVDYSTTSLSSVFPFTFVGDATAGPVTANATFSPGGDFDWALLFETFSTVSDGSPSDYSSADFSNTMHVNYAGPTGAVTYSASGVFPGTLPIAMVPEPSLVALLTIGLSIAGIIGSR